MNSAWRNPILTKARMIPQQGWLRYALWAVALGAGACAGAGTGLDEFGNPADGGGIPLQPTWTSIQARVFTPTCTQCHAGAGAPLGFSLEAAVSYQNLLTVVSVQRPDLRRVAPGAPDSSYLMLKLEGASGIVGGRMPFGLPPLSNDEIRAIRDWIAAGALRN